MKLKEQKISTRTSIDAHVTYSGFLPIISLMAAIGMPQLATLLKIIV